MILTVKERLLLGGILPKQGDFTTLKIISKLQQDLSFSEEEHKLLNFVSDSAKGTVQWNFVADKEVQKDVPIGEKATDIIQEALKKLNAEKQLSVELMGLFEKFVKQD